MLTGKCKIDFEAWYIKNYNDARPPFLNHFYNYPFPFQQGVYLQFFREKGVFPEVKINIDNGFYVCEIYKKIEYDNGDVSYFYGDNRYYLVVPFTEFPDYNTALTNAITQANEIYNKEK